MDDEFRFGNYRASHGWDISRLCSEEVMIDKVKIDLKELRLSTFAFILSTITFSVSLWNWFYLNDELKSCRDNKEKARLEWPNQFNKGMP